MTTTIPIIDSLLQERTTAIGALKVGADCLPLKEVRIVAAIADRIGEITMRQTFHNSHTEPLEAVYIFPLPGAAAVTRFELKVGSRTIRGIIKEREQARHDYQQALDSGKRAALLEQDRDDIFTVQVGNLPPGEEVQVVLTYSQTFSFLQNGTVELRLPMVIGPRYIPGDSLDRNDVGDGVENDTDIVGDASRITPPRLVPGFDPKIGFSIDIDLLQMSSGLADLCCSQHAIRTQMKDGAIHIALAQSDDALDRDFVLRWRAAGKIIQSTFLKYSAESDPATGMISIVPPVSSDSQIPVARDVIFLLDRSGSMRGVKMVSAARACACLLNSLNPSDHFAVLAFDNTTEFFPTTKTMLAADEGNRAKGDQYLRLIEARGGTEMHEALGEAIKMIQTSRREARQPIVILITDGQVGDESRILQRAQSELSGTRIFTIGVDTAVNEAFLRRLAALSGGHSSFVEPGIQVEEALEQIAREIGTPLITNLQIEDINTGIDADSVTPQRLPDLFSGRPVTIFFRFHGAGKIRVKGTFQDGSIYENILEAQSLNLPALTNLWARSRVMDLEDRFRVERKPEWKDQIIEIAIRNSLLTRFTAFVVVDETEIVNADGTRKKIVQPVAMPARWEMEEPQLMPTSAPARMSTAAFMRIDTSAPPMPMASQSPVKSWYEQTAGKIVDMVQERKRKKSDKRKMESVQQHLKSFAELLEEFARELQAGMVPSAEKMEKKRMAILREVVQNQTLIDFFSGPVLQFVRLLRNPGASMDSLKLSLDQLRKDFNNFNANRFWELSI